MRDLASCTGPAPGTSDDAAHDGVRVTVEVAGWPAPTGALTWLLRASGGASVVVDVDLA